MLPELDDEFAAEASEFETLDELARRPRHPPDPGRSGPRPRWPCARRSARPSPSWSTTSCPRRWSPTRCRSASRTWPCASRPRAQPRAVAAVHRPDDRAVHRRAARHRRARRQGRPRPAGRRRGRGASRPPRTTSRRSSPRSPSGSSEDADDGPRAARARPASIPALRSDIAQAQGARLAHRAGQDRRRGRQRRRPRRARLVEVDDDRRVDDELADAASAETDAEAAEATTPTEEGESE